MPQTVSYSHDFLLTTDIMQSMIFYPMRLMMIVVLVSFSSWLASLISGHIRVGVLMNFYYFSKVSKLTTH